MHVDWQEYVNLTSWANCLSGQIVSIPCDRTPSWHAWSNASVPL